MLINHDFNIDQQICGYDFSIFVQPFLQVTTSKIIIGDLGQSTFSKRVLKKSAILLNMNFLQEFCHGLDLYSCTIRLYHNSQNKH